MEAARKADLCAKSIWDRRDEDLVERDHDCLISMVGLKCLACPAYK